MQVIEARVWDPFVRVCHWSLATVVLVDWLTDEPRWMHVWLGYAALLLVLARVLWGFIGHENARFANFVRGPRVVFDYLAGLIRFSSQRYLGHSPAGGAMIVALLVMIAATALTGMINLAQDQGQGLLSNIITKVERPRIPGQKRPPLLTKKIHEGIANITIALVVLHVCGVVLASIAHRENLVRAMITGRKRALSEEPQATASGARKLALNDYSGVARFREPLH
jgi:cytochrome b